MQIKTLFSRLLIVSTLAIAAAPQAMAELPPLQGKYHVSSGTGFFVSNSGHIITNEHVIRGCSQVHLQGAFDAEAKVIATDTKYDLALLRSDQRSARIATIRHIDTTTLKMGEPVLVMGYPKDSYKQGEYQLAQAEVVGVKGPMDEPHWIQFSDSAQQGNSGGPLLDASGNVAGVIVGKSTVTRYVPGRAEHEVVRKSDVAISLPILKRFMDQHRVSYRMNGSYTYMMANNLEALARAYIVNVLCMKKVSS